VRAVLIEWTVDEERPMTRDQLYHNNPPPPWYQVTVIILSIIASAIILTIGWHVMLWLLE
jgi:hypothetical protein